MLARGCPRGSEDNAAEPASDWLQTQLTLALLSESGSQGLLAACQHHQGRLCSLIGYSRTQWELGLLSPNQFSLASTPNLPYSQLVLAKLWQSPLVSSSLGASTSMWHVAYLFAGVPAVLYSTHAMSTFKGLFQYEQIKKAQLTKN